MTFFLISNVILGLLYQLHIFWRLYLIELLAFNRSGATQAAAVHISKAFDRVWHAGLLFKLNSYGISGQIFGLISSFLSNRWLWVVLDGNSSQGYLVYARVFQESILGPTFFLLYINNCPDDVTCVIAIYADTTLYSKASDLWQQLGIASELESDLSDTVEWGKWNFFKYFLVDLSFFCMSNNDSCFEQQLILNSSLLGTLVYNKKNLLMIYWLYLKHLPDFIKLKTL